MSRYQFAVVDLDLMESAPVGVPVPESVLAYFTTADAASFWIGQQDLAKVERGGFSIDGPTEEFPEDVS